MTLEWVPQSEGSMAGGAMPPLDARVRRALETWQAVLARLSTRLNPHIFRTWMTPVRAVSLDTGVLTLGVPSDFHQDWLRNHYLDLITELAAAEQPGLSVRLQVMPELEAPLPGPEATPPRPAGTSTPPPGPTIPARVRQPTRLQPRYTLENYVAGPSNQLAAAAARAVAEAPARQYNPLFVFGGVGLGKTHLLHAIGNRVAEHKPDWNVLYLSAEDFTNDLIWCLEHRRMDDFRARYRAHCDVLLLDDVHFLAGKDRTQEEFFHCFNHLHASGRQVVVTSDKFPHQMEGVEERLRTRLQWGLIVDIQAPELETRQAIVRRKAREQGFPVPDEVADFLATHIKANVRELEGALLRLAAQSSMDHVPITLELCRRVLKDVVLRPMRTPTCADVITHVASHYSVEPAELRGHKRHRTITLPRHVAMYLCRRHTHASFPEIGMAFGGKDHTTVMASVRKIEALLIEDAAVANAVEQLGRILSG